MRKTWFLLGVLTAVAIQAQRLPLPPRVRTAALALGKQNSSPQSNSVQRHKYVYFNKRKHFTGKKVVAYRTLRHKPTQTHLFQRKLVILNTAPPYFGTPVFLNSV